MSEHYIIQQLPQDLDSLQAAIQEFLVSREKTDGFPRNPYKTTLYEIWLYRESQKLPATWKKNESYLNTDRIEHHANDCIGRVIWNPDAQTHEYFIMEKSSSKNDYGRILHEKVYYRSH